MFLYSSSTICMPCLTGSASVCGRFPGFSPGWNWTVLPGRGLERPSNWNRVTSSKPLPAPVVNPRFFDQLEPALEFQSIVAGTLAPLKYLTSNCIGTCAVHRLSRLWRSWTSRCQNWDRTNIYGIADFQCNISSDIGEFSILTQWMFIRSQIPKREVNARLN